MTDLYDTQKFWKSEGLTSLRLKYNVYTANFHNADRFCSWIVVVIPDIWHTRQS